jgi:uncharacterized membrane protein YgdD (TMEM256/DUF423 family)
MFLAVGAGAFGAHALQGYFNEHPQLKDTFDTAVRYQMIHGLALFAAAWAHTHWQGSNLTEWAGWFFLAGVLLFSGSLYILSLADIRWMGAIAPIGGVSFLAGWAALFLAAWK